MADSTPPPRFRQVMQPRQLRREHKATHLQLLPVWRPRTRGDCVDMPRPCPYVSCKHHLAATINPSSGSITLHVPEDEIPNMSESCVLDVADRGPHHLHEIADLFGGLTHERIRQVEGLAMRKMKRSLLLRALWGELET